MTTWMPFARMFASVIGRPELLLLGAISWLKPSAWAPIKAQLRLKDDGALAVYRQRYLEGVPKRTVAEEAADARILYRRSAEVGGQELVGKAKGLDTGLFYDPATGE